MPGPGKCIYCPPGVAATSNLRREHVIAHKLGGQLILHQASCRDCERTINSALEAPVLTFMWLSARTHLGLPTSKPPSTLKVGTWARSEEGNLPEDLGAADFRWKDLAVADHPFSMMAPRFQTPGLLLGISPSTDFPITGIDLFSDGKVPQREAERETAIMQPFSPDITCRFIAKIAHGAAVAELGAESFLPLLPDVIMGRTNQIAHLVGSSNLRSRTKSENLHEITLSLRSGYVVAHIRLFAKLGLRGYLAVVGRPVGDLNAWHTTCRPEVRLGWS